MPDTLDLTGDIATAVNGAATRGRTLALGYIDDDGYPVVTFRGSTQVHGPQQLAIWARKADDGFAKAIAERPQVSLVYYGPDGPGPRYLSFRGRARVDSSANDEVYSSMIEGEQKQDPERNGVAVIIDVENVRGFGADGPFELNWG
ncbi:MAG TPA: pyridoxamine 5'-phosphate oxidase family protein [Thermoleophilaceae bacterium]